MQTVKEIVAPSSFYPRSGVEQLRRLAYEQMLAADHPFPVDPRPGVAGDTWSEVNEPWFLPCHSPTGATTATRATRNASANTSPDRKGFVFSLPALTTAFAIFTVTAPTAPTAHATDGSVSKSHVLRIVPARREKIAASPAKQVGDHAFQMKHDSSAFHALLNDIPWQPKVWFQPDEIVYEWVKADKRAVVTIEGDGYLSYAMLVGGKFMPGKDSEAAVNTLPEDLRAYLKDA